MAEGVGGVWPRVSVIIPHYNNHAMLARVVAAVRAQDYEGEVEIIVADDGSRTPPEIAGVTVLVQEDRGFRAAAARNLGASAATGEVVAFVDGDTLPEPGYLRAVVPHIRRNSRAVVVGSRLTGPERTEPEWLAQAWERTGHLSRADSTSWRFIISAALTCSADFFRLLGGFDASMVGYGGEDWEFGWRAWNAGAEFVHEPAAVAVHPEPDFGERGGDVEAAKNAETVALAHRITHPIARPAGVTFASADVAVVVPDAAGAGVVEAVIASWLRIDAHVYAASVPPLFSADRRVSVGAPRGERMCVELRQPWALASPETFYARATDSHLVCADGTRVLTARARALSAPAARTSGEQLGLSLLDAPQRLERLFADW
ncbi:glycosyltransferase [Corynebacterium timonense]|uniref:Glycosyl transferase family 2 n=1 Tax=Corynebacterium timonense TaxID=441500 RepID=A0A1H1LL29_9CORY|nr:glycosyltransferase [Corynebacterium timonense]SDR75283.1 Glycosyl transferase family 2 [Corynebacterium timonense]